MILQNYVFIISLLLVAILANKFATILWMRIVKHWDWPNSVRFVKRHHAPLYRRMDCRLHLPLHMNWAICTYLMGWYLPFYSTNKQRLDKCFPLISQIEHATRRRCQMQTLPDQRQQFTEYYVANVRSQHASVVLVTVLQVLCHRFLRVSILHFHCVCCVNNQPSAIKGNWSCSIFFCILRRGHGHCMRDKPVRDLTENTTSTSTFVGEYINPDKQCELVFGRTSIVCPYMPPCGRLWCGDDISGCRTQHMPWADGSICGEGLWCQRGQCIVINREALMKIDGAWGPWSR